MLMESPDARQATPPMSRRKAKKRMRSQASPSSVQRTLYTSNGHAASQMDAESENEDDRPAKARRSEENLDDEEDQIIGEEVAAHHDDHRESKEPEMGIIEEIYCENFMCHRRLQVKLCPNINFITGENGSGKSAIIAAIQICLGASARSTHRGKSIKNLIRHGHDGHALVRITLRNWSRDEHSDAFQPDLYGDRIIVERFIRHDGSAEYRLKNERGVLVSKLKADLDALLDHLNIQTGNPCAILDQENAKLFLKGNAKDKYNFFLQSTDLFKMRATYSKIDEETRAASESVLKREYQKIQSLEKAMNEANERYEEAKSIGNLENDLYQVKNAFAWSFVSEVEQEAQRIQRKVEAKKQEEVEATRRHEEISEQVRELELEQERRNDKLQEASSHVEEAHTVVQRLKQQIREAKRPLAAYKAESRTLQQNKRTAKERITDLQTRKEKKRREHEEKIANRREMDDQNQRRLTKLRSEVDQLQQQLDESNVETESSEELERVENQVRNCSRMFQDADRERQQIQQRIHDLQSQSQSKLAVFGSRLPALHDLIQRNRHKFTQEPIGPLGLYVKLPDENAKYAQALETALKGNLSSYLVVNGRDKATLDQLKRQCKCPGNQAPIVITKRSGRRYPYETLNTPSGRLARHTICNLLEVEDPDVYNALIDVCSTESRVIFEDREDAERNVLEGSSGDFRMAKYINETFLSNGDKFVVRNGNIAYIPNRQKSSGTVFSRDVQSSVRELEGRLQDARNACSQYGGDMQDLKRQREELMHQQRNQKRYVEDIRHRLHRRRNDLRSLERELDGEDMDSRFDPTAYDDEIADAEADYERLKQRERELEQVMARENPDLEGMLQELESSEKDEAQRRQDAQVFENKVNEVLHRLREMKPEQMRLERNVTAASEYVRRYQEQLSAKEEEVVQHTRKAERICPERVETTESHEHYGLQMADLKRQIEAERERFEGMDLEELRADRDVKTDKYEEKKETYDQFARNLHRVRRMLDDRQQMWKDLRKEISKNTGAEFNHYMGINNFAGQLKFQHHDKKLDMSVLRNEQGLSKKSKVTDMKELSGGERSYTQVSLLLALGESIECPFRVMDEFDVFMDSVNRDMTIQLLVAAAKQQSNKQFIFVTPNDLSTLERDDKIKVQRMDPPRDRLNASEDH